MNVNKLTLLEQQASAVGLLLRIQMRRPLSLWAVRLVVAQKINSSKIQLLGEIKGWAYPGASGLQLDTMQVNPSAPKGIGHLIWASIMAWALEETPCRRARLLAIHDDDNKHARLIKYFNKRGFNVVKEVGSSPFDLPFRMVWGGAGSLMTANCSDVFESSNTLWRVSYVTGMKS